MQVLKQRTARASRPEEDYGDKDDALRSSAGIALRPGDLDSQFFREALADFGGEAIVDVARAEFGYVGHYCGGGCGYGYA
jgi:hypothetical protein